MDLLTILTQCSVPSDFTLLLALALSFSHGQPYTVKTVDEISYGSEDATLDSEPGVSQARAMTRAQATAKLHALGGGPGLADSDTQALVGLLPVPRAWAALYQQPDDELLDPCVNVSIASAQLSEFEADCAEPPKPAKGRARGARHDVRRCVLDRYAEAIGAPMFADEVRDVIARQQLPSDSDAPIDVTTEAMLSATVFAQDGDAQRAWGADRLFVPAPAKRESKKPINAKQKTRGAK